MTKTYQSWKPVFLIPALFFLAIMFLYPIFDVFRMSFYKSTTGMDLEFVGLYNYQKLFNDEIVTNSIRVTVWWTIFSVAAIMLISLSLALVLNEEFALKRVVIGSLLIPWIIPRVIGAMDWGWVYNTLYGFFNEFLLVLGIVTEPLPWLGDTRYAFFACLLASLWCETPYFVLMMLSGIKMISPEVYEASKLDGANKWQRFRHITLPLLRPTWLSSSTLATVWSFGGFVTVYALTAGGPVSSTDLITIRIYKTAFKSFSFGYANTIGVIVFLILAAFSILYVQFAGRKID